MFLSRLNLVTVFEGLWTITLMSLPVARSWSKVTLYALSTK